MIRRHALPALAVLVMGLLVSAPAEAGGTAGAIGVRKDAYVIIRNQTKAPYYVVVTPERMPTNIGPEWTVGWARNLGAVLVNPGTTVRYPVPAGVFGIAIFAPASIPRTPNASLLPYYLAGAEGEVTKGKSSTKTITGNPPEINPKFDVP